MEKLTKQELKQLLGGLQPPDGGTLTLEGWRYDNGTCYCDWRITYADGSAWEVCESACATSNCTF